MILPHKTFHGKFFRKGSKWRIIHRLCSHNTAEEEQAHENHFDSGFNGLYRHAGP